MCVCDGTCHHPPPDWMGFVPLRPQTPRMSQGGTHCPPREQEGGEREATTNNGANALSTRHQLERVSRSALDPVGRDLMHPALLTSAPCLERVLGALQESLPAARKTSVRVRRADSSGGTARRHTHDSPGLGRLLVAVDGVAAMRDVRELGLDEHGGALGRLLLRRGLVLLLEQGEHLALQHRVTGEAASQHKHTAPPGTHTHTHRGPLAQRTSASDPVSITSMNIANIEPRSWISAVARLSGFQLFQGETPRAGAAP